MVQTRRKLLLFVDRFEKKNHRNTTPLQRNRRKSVYYLRGSQKVECSTAAGLCHLTDRLHKRRQAVSTTGAQDANRGFHARSAFQDANRRCIRILGFLVFRAREKWSAAQLLVSAI